MIVLIENVDMIALDYSASSRIQTHAHTWLVAVTGFALAKGLIRPLWNPIFVNNLLLLIYSVQSTSLVNHFYLQKKGRML